MKRSIEGLVLKKTPYQERHLICQVLLRSGRVASVLFYGGRGGGKKKKSSQIELGFMLAIELSQSSSTSELYRAKEWKPLWYHDQIRHAHEAFYLMCFWLEMIQKLSPREDLHDDNLESDISHEGLFRVLSNALFRLETEVKKEDFSARRELLVFLTKLTIEQGVFPEREHCGLCGVELKDFNSVHLSPEQGTFLCSSCYEASEEGRLGQGLNAKELWWSMGLLAHTKFQDLKEKSIPDGGVGQLFHYFCYQLNLEKKDFKSSSMVLN